ncbi:molybdenum cofactor guanylyltransferase [Halocatena pleomorpha]|uniref:Probable molybdenum cofactor guanylyltransferase n=1 Tax=Halocatena pleomorpha TaxID=1785090 RepID=A0A3P3RCN9_9EURY|nr:molybdenum cofactor guanylyltransferase [Halocatena pleomorpha]RRJ31181.1 molybdenum cofactor guanylyltransferase [Halocatena pleomorpha]
MTQDERTGLIVAGGRSRRFGDRDKAVANLAGVPMIRRVADGIAPVIDRLIVNCRTEQVSAIRSVLAGYDRPVRFVCERTPDTGPVAGIKAGLRTIEDDAYTFVTACDMPLVDSDVVAHLFNRGQGHCAVIPKAEDGRLQPLHAVYRSSEMVAACEAALADGQRSIRAAVAALNAVIVPPAELRTHGSTTTFENVNTPTALQAVSERFE